MARKQLKSMEKVSEDLRVPLVLPTTGDFVWGGMVVKRKGKLVDVTTKRASRVRKEG